MTTIDERGLETVEDSFDQEDTLVDPPREFTVGGQTETVRISIGG